MRVVKCLNGRAFEIATGLIPYGNISHFLFSNQIETQNLAKIENNFKTIVSRAKCSPLHLNLALEPKPTYEDLLFNFFDESSVELRIDNMLSCESLGISELLVISEFDQQQIEKF